MNFTQRFSTRSFSCRLKSNKIDEIFFIFNLITDGGGGRRDADVCGGGGGGRDADACGGGGGGRDADACGGGGREVFVGSSPIV